MAKISGPHVIPDEHVALMGRVAEAWSQFEFQIDQGIWRLLETRQQLSACVTSQFLSIHPRLRAFIALVMVRNASKCTSDALNTFSGSISGLVEKRNRAIHDPRYRQKDSGEIHRLEITAKPKIQFGFIPESKEGLQETINKIYAKTEEFINLRDGALAEIDALPPEDQPILLEIVPVKKDRADPTNDVQEP